jgi:hypothetical protein
MTDSNSGRYDAEVDAAYAEREEQLRQAEQSAHWWQEAAQGPHASDLSAEMVSFHEQEVARLRGQLNQSQEAVAPVETKRVSDGWGRGEWVESSNQPGSYRLDSSPEAVERDRAGITARAERRLAAMSDPEFAQCEAEYQEDAWAAQSEADVAAQSGWAR